MSGDLWSSTFSLGGDDSSNDGLVIVDDSLPQIITGEDIDETLVGDIIEEFLVRETR